MRIRTEYREIITGRKPCIRGLRITAYDVLDYLPSGMTESEILADSPTCPRTTFAPARPPPPR